MYLFCAPHRRYVGKYRRFVATMRSTLLNQPTKSMWMIRNTSLLVLIFAAGLLQLPAFAYGRQPVVKVVQNGESSAKPDDCRGIIVGPGVNQPVPFPA
jgi:hypothetical protein